MIGSSLLSWSERQWRVTAVTALILLLWYVWSILRPRFEKVISGVMNVGLEEQDDLPNSIEFDHFPGVD